MCCPEVVSKSVHLTPENVPLLRLTFFAASIHQVITDFNPIQDFKKVKGLSFVRQQSIDRGHPYLYWL